MNPIDPSNAAPAPDPAGAASAIKLLAGAVPDIMQRIAKFTDEPPGSVVIPCSHAEAMRIPAVVLIKLKRLGYMYDTRAQCWRGPA